MSKSARPTRFVAIVGEATLPVEVTELDEGRYQVTIDGRTHVVDSRQTGATSFSLLIEHAAAEVGVLARGDRFAVEVGGRTHRIQLLDERAQRQRGKAGEGDRELRAVMPGKVVALLVEVGAAVESGQGVLVIEAMKMENEIAAQRPGTVRDIRVQPGQTVEAGELLAIIE